ncbi:hypothetical protein [Solirubrobacter pauli]|uniref:hypothetical protein n=1 Tax=Solirubrobacter pauli TaxID=166793 RepID=UPI0011C38524|nr:hypothetical protein [Solirubrobacter pauli]
MLAAVAVALGSAMTAPAGAGPVTKCAGFTVKRPNYTVDVSALRTRDVSCAKARRVVRGFYKVAGGGSSVRIVQGFECSGQGNDRLLCFDIDRVVKWKQHVR